MHDEVHVVGPVGVGLPLDWRGGVADVLQQFDRRRSVGRAQEHDLQPHVGQAQQRIQWGALAAHTARFGKSNHVRVETRDEIQILNNDSCVSGMNGHLRAPYNFIVWRHCDSAPERRASLATQLAHMRVALAALQHAPDALRDILHASRPAYYAGAIAPDARVRNEAAREATHFYHFRDPTTWGTATERLFQAYPWLADLASLSEAQAAFVAGYLTHLAADEVFVIRLGRYAAEGNGEAIGGLSWAIEAGSPNAPPGLAAAFICLADFRADGLTTIADSALLERKAAGVSTIDPGLPLGELRRAIVAINGLAVSTGDSAREAEARAATGRRYFGANVASDFLAAAETEAVRRLRAFAAGTAADYDAAHLRDSAG